MSKESKPLQVLCVAKSTGGIAVYNRELATRLSAKGHDVHVICLSENREAYANELKALGLKATALYMSRYKISLWSDFKVAWAIKKFVDTNPVSIVIAHGAKAGILARLAGRLTGTPVIYTLHSMPFLKRIQGRKAFFIRQIEKLGTKLGGHLVALSESMKSHIVSSKVAHSANVSVIYTGIDADAHGSRRDHAQSRLQLGLDPDRPVVVWAGRLNRQKAPEVFLDAAAIILKALPQTQFFMAGEGPLKSSIEQYANKLKLGDSLTIAPWQDDVSLMLSACNVYVMTSRWEGLPLSLLEAMALECPVVVTAVDGITEAVNHEINGLLIPPDEPAAAAEQVIKLLNSDRQQRTLGREARQRVITAFAVEKMAAEWDALIRAKAKP